ncbi:tetratricopeptide repeat protein [Galbibacter sp. EGI 63066]|uniref:tetratricopeptide repeat protein n=1 Tax=Galbibacter sp. EGI 63066 TaxID=2993559 RepID=UPI0022489163|nr:tetratricopeptide repeat protein [Galbibacter sp. EGI 63066]MCX2682121.1 tetratricopeptide repeat protein [Galbibacter sp. EGI 63066]
MIRIAKRIILIFLLFFSLGIAGQNGSLYYKEALGYASKNKILQALKSIETAIEIDGNMSPPEFYFHKYEYLIKLGEYKRSIYTLNHALTRFPRSVLLLNARAEFYLALRIYKQAILDYEKIVVLVGSNELVDYQVKLASAKFLIRDFLGVAPILKLVLKEDPLNIDGLNLLAALHVELNNYEKAKEVLHTIANKNPNNISTIINLGYTYQKANQHEKAISYFNKALQLSPQHPVALCNRAHSWLQISNVEKAITDINQSISLLQTNSYAYMIRGKINLALKRKKSACEDFTIAKSLNFKKQYGIEIDVLLSKYCH